MAASQHDDSASHGPPGVLSCDTGVEDEAASGTSSDCEFVTERKVVLVE